MSYHPIRLLLYKNRLVKRPDATTENQPASKQNQTPATENQISAVNCRQQF
jgi:hypothetical protein